MARVEKVMAKAVVSVVTLMVAARRAERVVTMVMKVMRVAATKTSFADCDGQREQWIEHHRDCRLTIDRDVSSNVHWSLGRN